MNHSADKPKPLEATADKQSLVIVREANKKPVKTFVVLGVERGGTSMVAGMVRALGVDLGERAGRNHEDPRFLSDDQAVLKQRIEENNKRLDCWGFKMPKASLMLDFYSDNLRNPHFILVFRNIASVVDSWQTRGGSDPMQTSEHALNYYSTALATLHDSGAPLAFANYERACDNPDEFANSLAGFLGVDQADESIARAASVVTGEGGGYVDLPEYYFHIEALQGNAPSAEIVPFPYVDRSEDLQAYGVKRVGDRIVLESVAGNFPSRFLLAFELQAGSDFVAEQGLRIYMNFTGEFFPGHAFRPPLNNGLNIVRISTNGNVKQIALGSLHQDVSFGVSALQCYLDSEAEHLQAVTVPPARQRGQLEKKLRAVARRIRSLLQ